jgi:hypothetical protein
VPELEYALLAEHVRQEGGLSYITAAGIDTLTTEQVPSPWNLALLLGFRSADDEVGHASPLEISLRRDEFRLVQIQGEITPSERPADVPHDWPSRTTLGFNMGIVLPEYGVYSIDISVGGEVRHTLPLRVIAPVQPDATS